MAKLGLNRIDNKQENYQNVLPIWGEQTVGQTIFVENSHFSIVKVFTFRSPYGIEGKSKEKNFEQIIFHLREEGDGKDLRTITFSGSNVFDGDWLRLQFSPISDSDGKNYYIFFESQNSNKENAINLAVSEIDTYEKGNVLLSGEKLDGDLKFQTWYSQPSLLVVDDIFKDFRVKLFSDFSFTVFWLILLLVVFTAFLSKFLKR